MNAFTQYAAMWPLPMRAAKRKSSAIMLLLLAGLIVLDGIASRVTNRPPFSATFTLMATAYGNTIGPRELRDGYLADRDEQIAQLEQKLQPFDIILISSPFKGSSFFTEGTYTHMGIWLGSQTDDAYGNHGQSTAYDPIFHHMDQGDSLIQVDRFGVHFTPLSNIANTDQIIVFRNDTPHDITDKLDTIRDNLGKSYDYNLDGLDNQRLICTELIKAVFPKLQAEETRQIGRQFILPDAYLRALETAPNWQIVTHVGPGPQK